MNENVQIYIDKYPDEVKELYMRLRTLIYDSVSYEFEEKLWVKIPSYMWESPLCGPFRLRIMSMLKQQLFLS